MAIANTKIVVSKANQAVRDLRATRLSNGLPFMINCKELDDSICYLEYPDGKIGLARANRSRTEFTIIKYLNTDEAQRLRNKYRLS